jgi:ParB family transcriptional regulator, chromosome partitioning protein
MENFQGLSPKKKGLGRGLGALIPTAESPKPDKRIFFFVGIEEITPNPFQPRKKIKEAAIDQLADSIREKGIIQPLLVRKLETGYELIAGERRWRAAQKVGLTEVPVILKEAEPLSQLELALIENIQRQNLNAMEEADAYHRLNQEFNLSQEEVAQRVGKDRSSIANFLRLLKLSPWIQEKIREGALSFGHAKCLLGVEKNEDQLALAKEAIEKGLSVRDLEKRIKKNKPLSIKKESHSLFQEEDWVKEMIQKYKTRIKLKRKKKGGTLEILFHSEEELIRIVDLLMPK